MTRLLLDVGNTRVKYALDRGPMAAVVHGGDVAAAVAWVLRDAGAVDEVALVDVTGAARTVLGAQSVRELHPSAASCGVVNGYAEPARLGADRWAALIGARALAAGPVLVIDAGSALTCDVLGGDGRHRGGWIAPGLELSLAALAHGTHGARSERRGLPSSAPATETAAALHSGVRHAVLGFIERCTHAAAAELGPGAVRLLCGGDAAALAPDLSDARRVDDLVLRGLAHWLDAA